MLTYKTIQHILYFMSENKNFEEKDVFSTTELANILNVDRTTIFKKIKSGDIKAQKVGRNYIIHKVDIFPLLAEQMDPNELKDIVRQAVKKAVEEYGEAIKMLGRE